MAKVIITLSTTFNDGKHEGDSSKLVSLTELELCGLMVAALEGMDCNGSDEPIKLLDDNMTWFERKDLVTGGAMSDMQARGLMTFLNRKGIAMDNGGRTKEITATWCLTEAGVRAAQHAWATCAQWDAEMVKRRPILGRVLAECGH